MDRQKLLKLLLVMAGADGSFSQEEIALILNRADAWGIDAGTIEKMVGEAADGSLDVETPTEKGEKLEALTELVRVMGADGTLAEPEKKLFARLAASMEVSVEEINAIIDSLVGK